MKRRFFYTRKVKNDGYKKKVLFEQEKTSDGIIGAGPQSTDIIFKNHETGEILCRLHNKVVISGSQFTACKHFNFDPIVNFPSYNQSLGLENSVYGQTPLNTPKICLFGCGTDGCGAENSQVFPVDYTKRINPNYLIPFRYQLSTLDLSLDLRKKYFGRKQVGDRIAYYFKAFESEPTLHLRRIDGTLIDETIYESNNDKEAQCYVECLLQITKEDFREYFMQTTSIEDAKINNISLMSAWYSQDSNDIIWYQDIIPITQLNIPNEPLIDLTKGIDIIYHIYY